MAKPEHTHKSYESPGGPNPPAKAPEVGEFPKVLHGRHGETLTVTSRKDEREALASQDWKLLKRSWSDPVAGVDEPAQ